MSPAISRQAKTFLRVLTKSWRAGELESWRAGELESWRRFEGLAYYVNPFCLERLATETGCGNGLHPWKTGKLESWKTGKLENWKTGKLEN